MGVFDWRRATRKRAIAVERVAFSPGEREIARTLGNATRNATARDDFLRDIQATLL